MTTYLDGMPCRICGVPIHGNEQPLVYIPRIFSGPLRSWDAARVHHACYLGLDVLPGLAATMLEFVEKRVASTLDRSVVLKNEQVLAVFGQSHAAGDELAIWLRATGTSVVVPLASWPGWLEGHDDSELHPKERAALKEALPDLRSSLPDPATVLGRLEDLNAKWERIRAVGNRRVADRAAAERIRVASVQADFGERAKQFGVLAECMRTRGIACPSCKHESKEFRETPSMRLSCPSCGRSCGVEDFA